jgi:hypothetical protein
MIGSEKKTVIRGNEPPIRESLGHVSVHFRDRMGTTGRATRDMGRL